MTTNKYIVNDQERLCLLMLGLGLLIKSMDLYVFSAALRRAAEGFPRQP